MRGAIATSHHLATEAGAAALEAGGNAVDAALAAAATLCVVYPNNVALGGDLVALVRDPEGRVRFLNATGEAPSGQTLEALRGEYGDALPLRGIDTVTVPGGICGWNSLHEHAATRAWKEHFTSAIRHAGEGHPAAKSVAAALIADRGVLERDRGMASVFYPGGEPIAAGQTYGQPALATTLDRLAAGGSAEFYEGETAERWVAGLRKLGSQIALDDLRDYQAFWDEPLETGFRSHRVITSPPNTSGFLLLRALAALEAAGADSLGTDPLGAGAGALADVFRDGNTIREALLGDPRFGAADGGALLSATVQNIHRQSGHHQGPHHQGPRFTASPTPSGDTVGLSAVSADGWAVSLINSVYHGFGAGILEPTTGIIFQNRGTAFSLDPASPNAFGPGRRPRHTLMPVLIIRETDTGERLAWVPSTMGGSAQPQIHAQLLLRSLAGASPAEATYAPRWAVQEPRADGTVEVKVEEDVPSNAQEALARAGYKLVQVPRWSEDLGHSNLIRVEPDGFTAASDPRSDGSAIVVGAGGTEPAPLPTA